MKGRYFVFLVSLLLVSFLYVGLNQTVATSQYPVHNLTTGLSYPTIQAAIDANETLGGQTIFVNEGVYLENVVVNKSVSLIGENRDNTIINGNQSVQDNFAFMVNRTNDVVVEGFTMQNFKVGVYLLESDYCRVSNNNMVNCTWYAVMMDGSRGNFVDSNFFGANNAGVYIRGEWDRNGYDNIVFSNVFDGNSMFAIGISYSTNDTVSSNLVTRNSIGINIFENANDNLIVSNTLQDNGAGLSFFPPDRIGLSGNETLYHNNFINNTKNVDNSPEDNKWDNGYPSGGNYWSDYNGADMFIGVYQNETSSDGIGDTPYINTHYRDNYPLILPYPTSQNMTMESWDLYYQFFKKTSDLEGTVSDLGAENQNLTSAYTTLFSNYGNLQETNGNLTATYKATLTQLDGAKNGMYSFIAATVVLAFVVSLLAFRRKRK